MRERKKRNYNDDYDYNISDDEEKKKAENGEQSNADISGGHKLIAYKPNDAVEGEIATIERILAGRIRSNVKVIYITPCPATLLASFCIIAWNAFLLLKQYPLKLFFEKVFPILALPYCSTSLLKLCPIVALPYFRSAPLKHLLSCFIFPCLGLTS